MKLKSSVNLVKNEQGNVVIPIKDMKKGSNFYGIELENTKMALIAVKASDGNIRTAFNTCQVCYSSGRGYYERDESHI